MILVDTHCHLQDDPLGADPGRLLVEARSAGAGAWVVPGADLASSRAALALAGAHPCLGAAVGVHPWFVADGRPDLDVLAALAADPGVVAIGEIGLDAEAGSDLAVQEQAFRAQVGLARDLGLPVIVHSRGAAARLVEILEAFGPGPGGVLHAFGGSREIARRLRPLGFLRGVAGTVTRLTATNLRQVVARTPLDDLVLETDAPYLATARHGRGAVVPSDIADVAAALAELHGVALDEVARVTTANAFTVFPRLVPLVPPG